MKWTWWKKKQNFTVTQYVGPVLPPPTQEEREQWAREERLQDFEDLKEQVKDKFGIEIRIRPIDFYAGVPTEYLRTFHAETVQRHATAEITRSDGSKWPLFPGRRYDAIGNDITDLGYKFDTEPKGE